MFGSYDGSQPEVSEAKQTNSLLRIIAILIGGAILIGLSVYYATAQDMYCKTDEFSTYCSDGLTFAVAYKDGSSMSGKLPQGYTQRLCLSCGPGETLRTQAMSKMCLNDELPEMCRAFFREDDLALRSSWARLVQFQLR